MQVQRDLERFAADRLYFEEHRDELLEQYPEQWVAVYNQQVVGAAKEPKQLVRQLERKGVPPGETYWGWLSSKEELLIVPSGAR